MTVTNTLLTPTIISNELLRRFKNNLVFSKGASHEYDPKFDKIGDTYSLRKPVQYAATKSATLSVSNTTESSVALTVSTQAHVGFQFTSKDLTLTVDRFGDRYLDSAAVALANQFDIDGLTLAYQAACNAVGTPGTTPSTYLIWKQALAKLDKNSAPLDDNRFALMNSDAEVATIDALKGLFQSSTQIKQQYEKGRMGTTAGAEFGMSQNIRNHTVGALGGTPLVKGASQSGSTLITDGWTNSTGAVAKGDIFTLGTTTDKTYAVNPVSGDTLSDLRQFVVTADTTADSSGNMTIPIYPSISATGAGKTVAAAPSDNAALNFLGTAATAYPQNLVYHRDAICYAAVPLEVPKGVHFGGRSIDKDSGLSIRIVSQYDITNDLFITRADILYGWAARRPEWICRIFG